MSNPHPHFFRYLGFFGEEKIVPTSSAAMKQIMNDPAFESPGWFRLGAKVLLGDGLILAEGERHKVCMFWESPDLSPC